MAVDICLIDGRIGERDGPEKGAMKVYDDQPKNREAVRGMLGERLKRRETLSSSRLQKVLGRWDMILAQTL